MRGTSYNGKNAPTLYQQEMERMSEPPIRQAIYGTTDAITRRAAWYRNLVICISVIGMASMVLLIITWRPISLAIGTMMLPAVAGWFYWDTRLVRKWSQKTLQICRDGSLDVAVFTTTIAAMKHLPEPTIQSMLLELERYRAIVQEKRMKFGLS